METENKNPKSLCKVLAFHSKKHSSLDPGTVLRLFPQKKAQIQLINDIFSITSSYIQHVSPCLIFTEAKLKINATNLFFFFDSRDHCSHHPYFSLPKPFPTALRTQDTNAHYTEN